MALLDDHDRERRAAVHPARPARASRPALEWIVSGYALCFGLALVPAGRLGDRVSHRRLFLAGLAVFTVASAGLRAGSAQGPS